MRSDSAIEYSADGGFSPAHELLVSFHVYMERRNQKKKDADAEWARRVSDRLTPAFRDQIDGKTADEHVWHPIFALIHHCPNQNSVAGFLNWYETLSAGDIYEVVREYTEAVDVDLEDAKKRMIDLISTWDEQYFQQMDPSVLQRLTQEGEKIRAAMPIMSPQQFVDKFTNGMYVVPREGLRKVLVIPQNHAAPLTLTINLGKTFWLMYPAEVFDGADGAPPSAILHIGKCLADNSRMKILRFLHQSSGPRTYMDIVKHMGMAKSTVHQHLRVLRAAGLIRSHIGPNCDYTYGVRQEALDGIGVRLGSYLSQNT